MTKDYIFEKQEIAEIDSKNIVPIYTVEDNGCLTWEIPNSFLVKSTNAVAIKSKKIFDLNKTTKIPPQIILPRGIGNRHYASLNKLEGFSSSYVEFYINKADTDKIKRVWLFCNSSIFWLLREISGRTNLGGGMLKAEAIDLKNIPIYFEFDIKFIDEILEKCNNQIVENTVSEVEKDYHKRIDEIVFDFLGISLQDRKLIIDELLSKINGRYKKEL